MGWFGGYLTRAPRPAVPVGAQVLLQDPPVWSDGVPVRLVDGPDGRRLVVFGPCGATGDDLDRLMWAGDLRSLDSAATAWAGAYTLLYGDGHGGQTVWADPAGACPLYTCTFNGSTVWASSSMALAALCNSMPDAGWMAAHLVDPTGWTPGFSAWSNVEQVEPGHRVAAGLGTEPVPVPYWTPPTLSREEAVDRLRDDLAEGVRIRVAGRPASSDLSGGLDSSTLAALAARCGPVTGVTYHPEGIKAGGDVDHARLVARAHPAIRHEFMALGDSHLPFSDLDALPLTDEPAPSAITVAQFTAQLRFLVDHGAVVHLTGDGGDNLFMPPPVHLADLARSGRWLRLAADAQTWARLYRQSPWPLLASAVRRPRTLAGASRPMPWMTDYAKELAAPVTTAYPDTLSMGHADRALLAEARYVGRTAATENQLAAAHGIEMHNPFTDTRVVEAALAAPAVERWSARRYKPLLSDAVAGLLPPPVVRRGAKGMFAVDHHHGLRANLQRTLDLADGRLADLGLINPAAVRATLRRAVLGVDIPWGRLEPVLGAELWLRAAEKVDQWTTWEERAA
ncbi:albusnodin/ikarugamycin family macrolactam cyclase [Streptomyces sp. NPDC097617]|uniref:albusnodin/ikarugamycin family macrolactam cyclase n=1 Tax=Streptomyces sp. NPDC097617 TaxID=3366091 RepID=UPI0037F76CFC